MLGAGQVLGVFTFLQANERAFLSTTVHHGMQTFPRDPA